MYYMYICTGMIIPLFLDEIHTLDKTECKQAFPSTALMESVADCGELITFAENLNR